MHRSPCFVASEHASQKRRSRNTQVADGEMTISETIPEAPGNQAGMRTRQRRVTRFEAPRQTYETFVREHLADIRGWVEAFGVPQRDQDDVVQEVLIDVCRVLHQHDPARSPLRVWLKVITRNQAFNHLRRLRRRRERFWPDEGFDPAHQGPSAEARLLDQAERKRLHRLLDKVPKARREVLTAFELDKLRLKEIAEKLHITVEAAKTRLFRGRKELEAAAHRCKARRRGFRLVLPPSGVLDGQAALLRRIGRALRGAFTRATERAEPLAQRIAETLLGPIASGFAGISIGMLLLLEPGLAGDQGPAPRAPAMAAPALATLTPVPPQQALGELPSATATSLATTNHPPKVADAPEVRPPPSPALTGETDERRLLKMAMAALAIEREDLAYALLERHRHEFPGGRLARIREQLLSRSARPGGRE